MKLLDRFKQKNSPFWIFTISLMLGLIVPVLIMDGMFMDGVLYASVSNNLAQGYGSMWFLKFSELGFAQNLTFHEHPPFVFWIQALFFKAFGSSMYVERFYSLLCGLFTAWLMFKSWKMMFRDDEKLSKVGWISVFLWMMIPISFWSFQNNVHENTMGIFILLSFYFSVKGMHYNEKLYLNLILSGFFIFLASFSKGVPGFFTLGVPFLYWAVFRSFGFLKMVWYSFIMLAVVVGIYGLILLIPAANESLSIYFFERLLGRTTSKPTVDSRTWILVRLFMEVLPVIIICGVTVGIMKWRKVQLHLKKPHLKMSLFLILVGLSGSLPIMLTLVQKPFYFSPSLPFFGLGFAILIAPGLAEVIDRISVSSKGYKAFRGITVLCFFGVIVVSALQVGKVSRNPEVVHDMYLVADVVGDHTTINVHERMWNEWDMHCYMVRYWNISWDYRPDYKRDYYLMNTTLELELDSTYQKIDLPTVRYDLYKRVE
jgi:4-amino-4-deoxy-L-arabinose transferase-like glycosyltransferase